MILNSLYSNLTVHSEDVYALSALFTLMYLYVNCNNFFGKRSFSIYNNLLFFFLETGKTNVQLLKNKGIQLVYLIYFSRV